MEEFKQLISIIIPVFKTEKTVKRCIESVLSQSYENWEMILVDDGSPDNAGTICDDYSKKDARIKVIHQKNSGLSSARNTGLNNIRESSFYVAFLDSDDEMSEDALKKMLSFINSSSPDMLIGVVNRFDMLNNTCRIDHCDFPAGTNLYGSDIRNTFFEMGLLCKIETHLRTGGFCLPSILFKTELIRTYNLKFETKQLFGEDVRFCSDALMHANDVIFTQVPFFKYYYDSSAVSIKYADKYGPSTIQAYKYQTKIVKKAHLSKYAKLACIGNCWVGIRSFILVSINRNHAWNKIYKILYDPALIKCFLSVIFTKKRNLRYAQLSQKQKIASVLFLLGMYKTAYKLS